MKKKILGLLVIGLLCAGCGKVPTLKNGEEAVVTFKDGEDISVDDLYEELKDNYALSALVTMIDTQVLEDEFADYIDTAKENAESYLNAVKENYDDDDALLEAIQNYTGYSTIEAYQNSLYLSYMQTHATEEYAKLQITDKQIQKYYDDEVVGDIEVSHILITPEVTDDMTDDEKTAAEDKAKEKAESIIKELKATDKDKIADKFAELAKENSDDDATKDDGGSLGKINKDTLDSSYDELVTAAYELKDGAYSTEVITTELGYHVIYRTKSYDKASLEDSKDSIITALAEEAMEEDSTMSITALQYYRKEHGVEIQDSELQTQYAYYIQNQLSKTSSSSDSE